MVTWLVIVGTITGALIGVITLLSCVYKMVTWINRALDSLEQAIETLEGVVENLDSVNRRVRRIEHRIGLKTDRRTGVDRRDTAM